MTPQRRTALVSVLAACALIALKVAAGIPSHSLGLLSEAAHSGIDLVAALLTFFAVGVAGRPADPSHAYGHGKAEHLAALAEAAILVVAAVFISWRAVSHLTGLSPTSVHAEWYALLALAGDRRARAPGAASPPADAPSRRQAVRGRRHRRPARRRGRPGPRGRGCGRGGGARRAARERRGRPRRAPGRRDGPTRAHACRG